MTPIPQRGPALPADEEMLLSFDVDCGELVDGHRFIARGLRNQGIIESDGIEAAGFSLEYELVPGVRAADHRRRPFTYLAAIDYEADVPLPWDPTDGGAIAPPEGGPSTHGSRGDWPLPAAAKVLRFSMRGVDSATGWPRRRFDGVLIVDLGASTASWSPTD